MDNALRFFFLKGVWAVHAQKSGLVEFKASGRAHNNSSMLAVWSHARLSSTTHKFSMGLMGKQNTVAHILLDSCKVGKLCQMCQIKEGARAQDRQARALGKMGYNLLQPFKSASITCEGNLLMTNRLSHSSLLTCTLETVTENNVLNGGENALASLLKDYSR